MLSGESWVVEEYLEVLESLQEFLLDRLMISFKIYWQEIADLLHVDFLYLPLDIQEFFKSHLGIIYLLRGANQDHFSKIVRKIEEWMMKFAPLTIGPVKRHLFDSDFAWINLDFDLFYMIHNDLTITHLKKNSLQF